MYSLKRTWLAVFLFSGLACFSQKKIQHAMFGMGAVKGLPFLGGEYATPFHPAARFGYQYDYKITPFAEFEYLFPYADTGVFRVNSKANPNIFQYEQLRQRNYAWVIFAGLSYFHVTGYTDKLIVRFGAGLGVNRTINRPVLPKNKRSDFFVPETEVNKGIFFTYGFHAGLQYELNRFSVFALAEIRGLGDSGRPLNDYGNPPVFLTAGLLIPLSEEEDVTAK